MKDIELYDLKSKETLMDVNVIANIMQFCIPEYKDISIDDLKKLFDYNDNSKLINTMSNEDFGIDENGILFTSKMPNSNKKIVLLINIDAQKNSGSCYRLLKKSIYDSSCIISRQKGEIFYNSNNNDLEKIYSIWICLFPKTEMKDTINLYSFDREYTKGHYQKKEDCKIFNILFLNIGDTYNYNESKKDILKMLSLLFRKTSLDVKDKVSILNNDYSVFKDEEEVSKMCTLGEGLFFQGKFEGKASTIVNLINSNLLSKEDAFKFIGKDFDLLDSVKNQLNY